MKNGNLTICGRIFMWLYYWFDLYVASLQEEDDRVDYETEGEAGGLRRD